jgi:hypothetical protein
LKSFFQATELPSRPELLPFNDNYRQNTPKMPPMLDDSIGRL